MEKKLWITEEICLSNFNDKSKIMVRFLGVMGPEQCTISLIELGVLNKMTSILLSFN